MKEMTLAQVEELAKEYGYEVEVEKVCVEYDWEREEEVKWEYQVSFGHECTEEWVWMFEDLDGVSYDCDHVVWQD